MPFAILWPTFALVALIILVWFWLTVERGRHIKRAADGGGLRHR